MIFNDWWEKHHDKIFEIISNAPTFPRKNGQLSLYDLMEKCWQTAEDLTYVQASKISAKDLVRIADNILKNEEIKQAVEE